MPQGTVEVEARGYVGNVPRVGKTFTLVTLGGQDVEVVVQMKAQGSVRGRVMELYNGVLRPLPFAQYYVSENSFPFRRIPDEGAFRTTDANGNYEVSGLYAGRVEVVARDSTQTTRRGKAFGHHRRRLVAGDQAPDIVMETSVGTLRVLMRDPATGAGVPDAMVRLGAATWSVTGADGVAIFEGLLLGTYDVYAFNAPTGQSGRLKGVRLLTAGEIREATVYLDVRGEIDGYLLDTADPRLPVAGGTVALRGSSAGGNISALATSSGRPDQLGYFLFGGIPEGEYSLTAAAPGSVRRGSAVAALTETAPRQTIEIVLEAVTSAHFRLYEKLRAGDSPVDTSLGVFSLRLTQPSSVPNVPAYDFTQLDPDAATQTYFFRDLLAQRPLNIAAREGGGEQRKRDHYFADVAGAAALGGAGSAADPYRVVLGAKGAVQITVRDAANQPVPRASVTPGDRRRLVAAGHRRRRGGGLERGRRRQRHRHRPPPADRHRRPGRRQHRLRRRRALPAGHPGAFGFGPGRGLRAGARRRLGRRCSAHPQGRRDCRIPRRRERAPGAGHRAGRRLPLRRPDLRHLFGAGPQQQPRPAGHPQRRARPAQRHAQPDSRPDPRRVAAAHRADRAGARHRKRGAAGPGRGPLQRAAAGGGVLPPAGGNGHLPAAGGRRPDAGRRLDPPIAGQRPAAGALHPQPGLPEQHHLQPGDRRRLRRRARPDESAAHRAAATSAPISRPPTRSARW